MYLQAYVKLSSMVQFKNRYMVMEVFVDANRELGDNDPIILSAFNVSKAIKDSIQLNFGECGLAVSLGSFQGYIVDFSILVLSFWLDNTYI